MALGFIEWMKIILDIIGWILMGVSEDVAIDRAAIKYNVSSYEIHSQIEGRGGMEALKGRYGHDNHHDTIVP